MLVRGHNVIASVEKETKCIGDETYFVSEFVDTMSPHPFGFRSDRSRWKCLSGWRILSSIFHSDNQIETAGDDLEIRIGVKGIACSLLF